MNRNQLAPVAGVVLSLLTLGCAGLVKSQSTPVLIEFKGKPGTVSETRYYSGSRTITYAQGQVVRDRIEGVDFSVRTTVQGYDPSSKILKLNVSTVRKDGNVDLHDLAFPELNEKIDFVVNGVTGVVMKAGAYPPHSIFFVPSLPMPKGPVEVGDTWTLDHTWYSASDQIPLRLSLVGIFKDIVNCEGGKRCADLEISGSVELMHAPTTPNSSFISRVWGRVLFHLERGDVIRSDMRSREEMSVPGDRVVITSCVISETKPKFNYAENFECQAPAP